MWELISSLLAISGGSQLENPQKKVDPLALPSIQQTGNNPPPELHECNRERSMNRF